MAGREWFQSELRRVRADIKTPRAANAVHTTRRHVEDVPVSTPELDILFAELDVLVANFTKHGDDSAALYRLGSIAGHRSQVDFYYRAAASPAIRQICEVGFNAGHSAAVWLTANPTATVQSFDLFHLPWNRACASLLKARFPGRLTTYRGDSLSRVPEAPPFARPCDLVHVDGKHDYIHTIRDALNLISRSSPGALFMFDDQCNPAHCESPSLVPGGPSSATCDLQSAGVLTPIVGVYGGPRQYALFRANSTPEVLHLAAQQPPLIPCSRMCRLVWARDEMQAKWDRGYLANRLSQRSLRAKDCQYSRRENRSATAARKNPDPSLWVVGR